MNDVVYRQQAIDEIMSLIEEPDDDFCEGVRTSASVIYQLPSAQSCKRGKWMVTHSNYRLRSDALYRCDQCGDEVQYITNYCPNCGARMDGESE